MSAEEEGVTYSPETGMYTIGGRTFEFAHAVMQSDMTDAQKAQMIGAMFFDDDTKYTLHAQVREKYAASGSEVTRLMSMTEEEARAEFGWDWQDEHARALAKAEAAHAQAKAKAASSASWEPQNLDDVLDGSYQPPKPTYFVRSDGVGLFYPGVVNEIHMEAGGGKTWVALAATAERLTLGERVLYIDHEEHRGRVVSRLLSLGLTPDQVRNGFHYIQPEAAPTGDDLARLTTAGYSLVVVDTVGESIRLVTGGDSNSTDDVTDWHAFNRAFARSGACVLVIDHITKAADNPLFPIGSQAKYAGYKGAVYLMEAPKGGGLAQGQYGYLSIKLAKDNGGGLGLHKGDLAAEFHLDSIGSASLWELRAPDASTQVAREAQARLNYRDKLLAEVPSEGITRSKLREALGLRGNNFGPFADALEALLETGALIQVDGPRGSKVLTPGVLS